MDLVLSRDEFRSDGIFGEILDSSGNHICHSLEHAYPVGTDFVSIIPCGIYLCVRGVHKLEDGIAFETFQIIGVSGHSGLLFHKGNFNRDSKGCVLVGESVAPYGVDQIIINSEKTFEKFMVLQAGLDCFNLKVLA